MRKFSVVTFILFLSLLASARVLAFQVESSGPILGPQVNNSTENKGCFTNLAFGQFSFYFSFTDSVYFPSHHVHYFVFLGADEADPSRVTLSADLVTTFRGIRVGTNNIIVPFCEGASATAEFLPGSEQRHAPFSASFSKITYEEYVGLVRGFGGTPRPNSGDRIGHVVIDLGAAGGSASISNMSSALCPFDSRTDSFICPSYPLTQPYESFKELANVQINVPPPAPCQLALTATPEEILPFLISVPTWLGSEPRQATITAMLTNCATGNITVNFTTQPPPNGSPESGGHNEPHALLRPTGQLFGFNGITSTINQCTAATDENGDGSCTAVFFPIDVSGQVKIVGEAEGAKAETSVTIRVPRLSRLTPPPSAVLTGFTDSHPDNHNGTATTLESIHAIAADFFAITDRKLRINDISLPLGGLFDIHTDWLSPHQLHRVGVSVDISRFVCSAEATNDCANHTAPGRILLQRPIPNTPNPNIWGRLLEALCKAHSGHLDQSDLKRDLIHCEFERE